MSASNESESIADRLNRMIAATGPLSLSQFMSEANAHYYGSRDPLGVAGDFITAPEISQIFGELIGLCLADVWMRAGSGLDAIYVELGPGRGTLALDALRSMKQVNLRPSVHLVENSPVLRERQISLLPTARHHDDIATLPTDRPLLIVANEFFDALPIQQIQKTERGWRERVIIPRAGGDGRAFDIVTGERAMDAFVPPAVRDSAKNGDIFELSPAAATIALSLFGRVSRQGGCAIIIDYGYDRPGCNDTLQAVKSHQFSDPFSNVGETDLTAHVNFYALSQMALQCGLVADGPVGQGEFLTGLGIDARAQSLTRHSPERAPDIMLARERLIAPNHMGTLFRVLSIRHPDWPQPEGFT